ncbi:prepilin-type N-terminal cleavage/methylation domain-containing protein [bacterium]|nr:prepilin-type N-terminal cleavage/methylation domain-containing protein [bacterium]
MKIRSENGFTLIEVIMASLILVIGVAIISSVISRVVRNNFYSQRHTQAVILAQNKIEELLNDGYASPNLAAGEYENPLNPVNATGDSSGFFFQFWIIDDLRPIPRSKMITSIVRWVPVGSEADSTADMEEVILTAACIDPSN